MAAITETEQVDEPETEEETAEGTETDESAS